MLNFLFPRECLICSKVGSWLCEKCRKNLVSTLPNCYKCKKLSNQYLTHKDCLKLSSFEKIITIWKYNQYSKALIHNYKYKNRFKIGDFLFSLFEEKLKYSYTKETLLIPLPSYKMKVLERGFNPTEILTKLIARKLNLEVKYDLFFKSKSSISQASLNYEERKENVKNVFYINKKEIKNIKEYKKIVIIDDIITTGSTLDEIGYIFKRNLSENISLEALCIFQGSFRKNECQKFVQPNKAEKKAL